MRICTFCLIHYEQELTSYLCSERVHQNLNKSLEAGTSMAADVWQDHTLH